VTTDKKDLLRKQRMSFPWHEAVKHSGVEISFIVPCYNEEVDVADTLTEIVKCMGFVGKTFEIVVIDDCSKDATVQKVTDFINANPSVPVTLRRNLVNHGWAQNFVDGAFVAKGKYYRMIPGDNVEKAEEMQKVVSLAGTADIIVPYQVEVQGKSAFRVALSGVFTTLVNILSGNKFKYYNGCSLYRTFDIMRWHVRTGGYGFQAETLTRLVSLGFTYVEVPVRAQDRTGGKSKAISLINILSAAHSLSEIFLQRLRNSMAKKLG
jgi:glycosyltransferase involved in cell wall biosynthesis